MKKYIILMILAITMLFGGCSSTKDGKEITALSDEPKIAVTEVPVASKVPAVTETPVENSDLVLPRTVNDTGKVLIQTVSTSKSYQYNSYIITSMNGESIVVDPTAMPDRSVFEINPVAILSTHSHADHTDSIYTDSYDVPKLLYSEGEITTNDFRIYSVKASHIGDTVNGSNYIMVIEVDGLRIAHCGDLGQSKLTKEQLDELGTIDIAFMQFENSNSCLTVQNERGFQLIEQINPKIFITTHIGPNGEAKIVEKYGTLNVVDNLLMISKNELPDSYLNAYKILNKHKYQ